jgi:hypothetical protein
MANMSAPSRDGARRDVTLVDMNTKLHRVYLESLRERPEATSVERVILDDLLRLLDDDQPIIVPSAMSKNEQAPSHRCYITLVPADTMRSIQARYLTMTETLIMALCSRRSYAFFHPLFRAAALAYRERRPSKADYKVARLGRTVSYRLPRSKPEPTTKTAVPAYKPVYANETCFRCQRRGHITLDCPLGCRHCGQRGHTEGRCVTRLIGGVVL